MRSLFLRFIDFIKSPRLPFSIGEPLFRLSGMRINGGEKNLFTVKSIVVVLLDEIGDVVLTTPFLRQLRHNARDAWITLIVKPAVYNLVELCPYVNQVVTFDWHTRGHFRKIKLHWRALMLSKRYLWHRRFSMAIVPRWDVDHYHATFVAYFSGAATRVCYSENVNALKKKLNRDFDELVTHVITESPLKHEVQRNLFVIDYLGGSVCDDYLEMWLSSDDLEFAEKIMKENGVDAETPLVTLGIGAGDTRRMWPIENFIEVARRLEREQKARIIIIAGASEKSLSWRLCQALEKRVIDMSGNTSLRQACALLRRSVLFIGNDSGPMHLAAAVGVPVIEISAFPLNAPPDGPNSPERFHPWGVPFLVLQPQTTLAPCTVTCKATAAHCIKAVSVDDVLNAFLWFWDLSPSPLSRQKTR